MKGGGWGRAKATGVKFNDCAMPFQKKSLKMIVLHFWHHILS
jgi:hypothetical protein